MDAKINSLKEEIDKLNDELKGIQKENSKRTIIKNLKIFGRRLEEYSSYALVCIIGALNLIFKNQVPTFNLILPTFLVETGHITVSYGYPLVALVYYGICRTRIQRSIENHCEKHISDINEGFVLVNDREIRKAISDKEDEYYHLLRVNNIPQR